MVEKGAVTEDGVVSILQRYPPTTVLTLLREVAQFPSAKIDWEALISNTETGIKNAREYQMLWRHLAYQQPLIENIEEGAQPLDDDSDLEYELDTSPHVNNEAAMEVANCVQMLASGSANAPTMPSSTAVEGDMRNGHSFKVPSDAASRLHSSNINLPVSVQKQSQPARTFGKGLDANGSKNNNRRKRKQRSKEEDLELIAAVKKFGEGNWATIVKGEFKGDRTSLQLSQRGGIIKDKQENLNLGGANSSGLQLSEAQLAACRAINMAFKNNSTGCGTVGNVAAGSGNVVKTNPSNGNSPVISSTVSSQPQLCQINTYVRPGPPVASLSKPHSSAKKEPTKPTVNADSIQAAAVAAGARIASPLDAASLLKAVQSKNAVHIRGGSSSVKSSAAGDTIPLPPNVHLIRSGLGPTSSSVAASAASPAEGGHEAKGSTVKASLSRAKSPHPAQEMEDKSNTTASVQGSVTKPMFGVQEDAASLSRCLPKSPVEKGQLTSPSTDVDLSKQTSDVGNSQCAMSKKDVTENGCKHEVCNHVQEALVPKDGDENLASVQGSVSEV